MADLEGYSYHGFHSQVVSTGRWLKLAGVTLGGSCFVFLCIAATCTTAPAASSSSLFTVANPKRALATGHHQRLRLPYTAPQAHDQDALQTYGFGWKPMIRPAMAVTRASQHDWGDGVSYAINPNSRLGRLMKERKEEEARELREAASEAVSETMMSGTDSGTETEARVPKVDGNVFLKARRNLVAALAMLAQAVGTGQKSV